ncbi:MAG: Unknown protein [uncultured Aureispira sp.]|uniref:Uncharacterized protein n=1 Tax=uncultured Aureispira sp. TaxID=1331704 RepID=A0A6S6UGV9_9BACT|nr:MAG: Unknown protein [uncultured Aureispira sp.]
MMVFDNMKPENPYLGIVKEIIRKGIELEKSKLKLKDNENLKNQQLVEKFNRITRDKEYEKSAIGVCKEHVKEGSAQREDIYFYLLDDESTRVFYVEGKRLPMPNQSKKNILKEEYVKGTGNKRTGGIERYKLGLHGEPNRLKSNGIIAYIEKKIISEWQGIINQSIRTQYPNDTDLIPVIGRINEFSSSHEHEITKKAIIMHHFWIDITKNK